MSQLELLGVLRVNKLQLLLLVMTFNPQRTPKHWLG